MKGDYEGQMMFGNCLDLKFPNICFKGEEKLPKKTYPGNVPIGD